MLAGHGVDPCQPRWGIPGPVGDGLSDSGRRADLAMVFVIQHTQARQQAGGNAYTRAPTGGDGTSYYYGPCGTISPTSMVTPVSAPRMDIRRGRTGFVGPPT